MRSLLLGAVIKSGIYCGFGGGWEVSNTSIVSSLKYTACPTENQYGGTRLSQGIIMLYGRWTARSAWVGGRSLMTRARRFRQQFTPEIQRYMRNRP